MEARVWLTNQKRRVTTKTLFKKKQGVVCFFLNKICVRIKTGVLNEPEKKKKAFFLPSWKDSRHFCIFSQLITMHNLIRREWERKRGGELCK